MILNIHVPLRCYTGVLLIVACGVFAVNAGAAHDTVSPDDSQYNQGMKVFTDYCSRCHGAHADGKGRAMPLYVKLQGAHPSNFQLKFYSYRPKQYLANIVRDGGAKHLLSEYMPPFGAELTAAQIDDVVYFIQNVSLNIDDATPHVGAKSEKEK
ncbi:c-type cytochrome [Kaarinaea lacus]